MRAMPEAVDGEFAVGADRCAFGCEGWGSCSELAGEIERDQADGDVDEEDPAPAVVIGDPAAEDWADGGSGDDHDGVEREGRGAFGGRKRVDQDGLRDRCESAAADALQNAAESMMPSDGRDAAEERRDA